MKKRCVPYLIYLKYFLILYLSSIPISGKSQSYSGCIITGVDYAVRPDFPIYESPAAGGSETYAASGCQPYGAANTVRLYDNTSRSGNVASRCYNLSPPPGRVKDCKVVVMGITRCGYVGRIDFIPCDLDTYCQFILAIAGLSGYLLIEYKKGQLINL